jgi:phosphate starvation-inducible protein PhoH
MEMFRMIKKNDKVFHAAIAAHIMGKKANVKLSGSPEKVTATKNAIATSKALYEALNKSSSTMNNISELLQEKHRASKKFQEVTGVKWIL